MLSSREFTEANTAGPEDVLHYQPSRAIAAALDKVGLTAADLDHVEINEAFAAVSAVSARELGLDLQKVTPHGGAIALGGGGGQGDALILRAD